MMQVQPLADLLEGVGVPAAGSIASAVVFVVVFVLVYILGKAIVLPIVDRSLKSRDLDPTLGNR